MDHWIDVVYLSLIQSSINPLIHVAESPYFENLN